MRYIRVYRIEQYCHQEHDVVGPYQYKDYASEEERRVVQKVLEYSMFSSNHPCPSYELRFYRNDEWYSAFRSLNDLYRWFPKNVLDTLTSAGFSVASYVVRREDVWEDDGYQIQVSKKAVQRHRAHRTDKQVKELKRKLIDILS